MADLDANVIAPTRLKLLTMLTALSEAEFWTIRDSLEVSDSVLSKHIAALEEVDYVKRRKGVHRGRRTTWVALTPSRSQGAERARRRAARPDRRRRLSRRAGRGAAGAPARAAVRRAQPCRAERPSSGGARPSAGANQARTVVDGIDQLDPIRPRLGLEAPETSLLSPIPARRRSSSRPFGTTVSED
jgi:DNA-binding MarR family transcriptional regulator